MNASTSTAPSLAVTAYSLASAIGVGAEATLGALNNGSSGLAPCAIDGLDLDTYIGEVHGRSAARLPPALAAFDGRNNRIATLALEADGFAERVREARDRYGAHRIAVILGTTTAGILEAEAAFRERDTNTGALPTDFSHRHTVDHYSTTEFAAAYLDLRGPTFSVSTACSSSSRAFADAARLIAAGACDAAVVGGSDSICRLSLCGFSSLALLSPNPCRPNDIHRDGISIGEAAGFALLERASDDDSLMLAGYGTTSDAFHMASPHPRGEGARRAMNQALAMSGLEAADIDYLNLHGTGSKQNDLAEAIAVAEVFGGETPCSSTKGWTGHTLGAAGILEAVITLICLREGLAPANLNTERPDPELPIRILTSAERGPLRAAMSNSFGFGGNNSTLLFVRR